MMKNSLPVLFLIVLLISSCTTSTNEAKNPDIGEYVSLSIEFSNGQESISYDKITWREGMTVLDLLHYVQKERKGLEFKTKEFEGIGSFVFSINDIDGDNKKYWLFCINGRPSDSGADSKSINKGDVVVWHYTDKSNPC